MTESHANAEQFRLQQAKSSGVPWKKWGPYLSERQWGTVREDYSPNGNAWDYFTHDQARSRAYHWGEDGLAGFSDEKQRLCFALALWNGADPILKERLFGLTNSEGNHGEDVKEYYFYLDSTPTHSYMKYLYKYPQRAYPYADLVETNRRRNRTQFEFELLDTGVFDDDRYFDVFVEYAKQAPEEILVRITAWNRGPAPAIIHILPTLWFRNTWLWGEPGSKGSLSQETNALGDSVIAAQHPELGARYLYCEGEPALLFTENETNEQRIFGTPNTSAFVKDGINEFVVQQRAEAVNPNRRGTKAAAHYSAEVEPGASFTVRLRLSEEGPKALSNVQASSPSFSEHFDAAVEARRSEADAFYESISPDTLSADERNVMRQALAGMLWTKQYYFFDLDRWLEEHQSHLIVTGLKRTSRNKDWFHMFNDDVISMPDKWEYPWYAAWDLAFHCTALACVDLDFAKQQLELMLRDVYLHPSGQLPAYEWNFGDVNPPVHAWATLFIYSLEKEERGKGDREFLQNAFHKLLVNFTWWVNRKDPDGHNVFEGGFLGLDNIGVFDRSSPLPTGGHLEQADGTAWMALFSQNMLEIALELATYDPAYESVASKFVEHFFWIASAMDRIGERDDEMWDEEDGFFYDILRFPNGGGMRLKVRSLVGLLPLAAVTVFPGNAHDRYPRLLERAASFIRRHPEVIANIAKPGERGHGGRQMLAVLNEHKLRRVLSVMLDEAEFLGPYGIRSLSRYHEDHPFVFEIHGEQYRVAYQPAESDSGMFGGNSNWRGPIWFPMNLMLVRALLQYYLYYGDNFKIECPTGSGKEMNLFEVSREISRRLSGIFLRDKEGRRPVYGGSEKFQTDPHWRDNVLFYEYFHGDNGAGIGASHQTGWTGSVARLIQLYGYLTAEDLLADHGMRAIAHVYQEDETTTAA